MLIQIIESIIGVKPQSTQEKAVVSVVDSDDSSDTYLCHKCGKTEKVPTSVTEANPLCDCDEKPLYIGLTR